MALGLRRNLNARLACALALWAQACSSGHARPSAPAAVHPSPPSQAQETPQDSLGSLASQYIVSDAERQRLVLASSEARGTRVLATASGALLQPELGLLWFRAGDELRVLELDNPDAGSTVIVKGVPAVDRFAISRADASSQTEDGCDLAWLALDWRAKPRVEVMLERAPGLRLVGRAWLKERLRKPAKRVGERRAFAQAKRVLPLKAAFPDCDPEDGCGATLPFGQLGLELVLIRQEPGGDCVQSACLLRDPKTGAFATPPLAATWGRVESTRPGPCGPYMFDRAGTAYLVDRRLCQRGSGCRALSGPALGWLEPGETVGDPGLGDFEEPSAVE